MVDAPQSGKTSRWDQLSKRFIVVLIAATIVAGGAPTAAAAQVEGNGTVVVTITAPEGVPASVQLEGESPQVAVKAPGGQSATQTLTAPVGKYRVVLPGVTFEGARYLGQSSTPEVTVRPGVASRLEVTYTGDGGARDLHVSELTANSVSLSWTAPPGARSILRRTYGTVPARSVSRGAEVAVQGSAATDRGVKPGKQLTYALFTLVRGTWRGPLAVTVNPAPAQASTQASYVMSPSTVIARAGDIASTETTGDGVRITTARTFPAPQVGSSMILPISPVLPGGYLGVVDEVATDGHTVKLVAGGLADAFDYYRLDVPDLEALPQTAIPETGIASDDSVRALERDARGATTALAAAVPNACRGGGVTGTVVGFDPGVRLGGHFRTTVDRYGIRNKGIPVSASVDAAITATVTGAATVDARVVGTCSVTLGETMKIIAVTPVPISAKFTTAAKFDIGGAMKIENVGFTATAGVEVRATLSPEDSSVSGGPVLTAQPLTPRITTADGVVRVRLGGELVVGPGAGTSKAGVIAGIGGELLVLDASAASQFPYPDPRFNQCAVLKAESTGDINLIAKAFLGKYSATAKYRLFKGTDPFPGSPWHLPSGCQNLQQATAQGLADGPGR